MFTKVRIRTRINASQILKSRILICWKFIMLLLWVEIMRLKGYPLKCIWNMDGHTRGMRCRPVQRHCLGVQRIVFTAPNCWKMRNEEPTTTRRPWVGHSSYMPLGGLTDISAQKAAVRRTSFDPLLVSTVEHQLPTLKILAKLYILQCTQEHSHDSVLKST